MSVSEWPSSPLDAAERAFAYLTEPPTSVVFDARGVPGLPGEILPLGRLRAVLLSQEVAPVVRDVVWRELVTHARRDGPAWVVAVVGLAMPGLRRVAGSLAAGWRGDTDDLDADLLLGFLDRLKTIDLDEPRVCGRLIDAGLRRARKARDAESDTRLVHVETVDPIMPIQPWDHPDLVLARAVAIDVIDADDAKMIAATRLEDVTLGEYAQRIGVARSTASDRRASAERRLVAAITSGALTLVPLRIRDIRRETVGRLNGA